jgi:DNA-3-methyladenine glycosylase II
VLAARAIYGRLLARFGGTPPTPEQILADDPEDLRSACGFSRAKTRSLRSLAEHILDGSLEIDRMGELPDDEVIRELVAVWGIGEWTAHMFLMFQLGRPDILPVGDQGIRRAVERAYALDAIPSPEDLTRLAAPWRPHRTAACLLLWHSLDNAPAA